MKTPPVIDLDAYVERGIVVRLARFGDCCLYVRGARWAALPSEERQGLVEKGARLCDQAQGAGRDPLRVVDFETGSVVGIEGLLH